MRVERAKRAVWAMKAEEGYVGEESYVGDESRRGL